MKGWQLHDTDVGIGLFPDVQLTHDASPQFSDVGLWLGVARASELHEQPFVSFRSAAHLNGCYRVSVGIANREVSVSVGAFNAVVVESASDAVMHAVALDI